MNELIGFVGFQLRHVGPLLCQAGSFIAARGLSSCGAQALEYSGFSTAVCGHVGS